MAEKILSGKIKQLVYTTEELSQEPLSTTVIDNGILVYEKTSSGQIKCKMGDGVNVWSGLNYIEDSDKMDKNNPTGTGSLSINRAEGSTIGENSVALGSENIASYDYSSAIGECCISGSYKFRYFNLTKSTVDNITNIILKTTINNSEQLFSVGDDILIRYKYNEKWKLYKSKVLALNVTQNTSYTNPVYNHEITISDDNHYFDDIVDELYNIVVFITLESSDTFYSSHSEGFSSLASGNYSHAEGDTCEASGYASHAEGMETTASGYTSHAEGYWSYASGYASHAEGDGVEANGDVSHAEGNYTEANGDASHAEGDGVEANGYASHAEGDGVEANGYASHAEGYATRASSNYQHVQGKYNIEDSSSTYAHIVGGGTSDSDRKNIHTLDWNGNAVFSGDVTATNPDGTEVSLLSLQNSSSSGGSSNIQASTTDLTAGVSELATGTIYVVYE